MAIRGIICACQAGGMAALASVCAKLAASSESAEHFATLGLRGLQILLGLQDNHTQFVYKLSLVIRGLGIFGIFLCNAIMWVLFTKSMHLCSSTLEATAFNTASNFIFTALVGWMLFGDHIGFQWCLGSLLMVLGLIILHRGSQDKNETSKLSNRSHDYLNEETNKIDSDSNVIEEKLQKKLS